MFGVFCNWYVVLMNLFTRSVPSTRPVDSIYLYLYLYIQCQRVQCFSALFPKLIWWYLCKKRTFHNDMNSLGEFNAALKLRHYFSDAYIKWSQTSQTHNTIGRPVLRKVDFINVILCFICHNKTNDLAPADSL